MVVREEYMRVHNRNQKTCNKRVVPIYVLPMGVEYIHLTIITPLVEEGTGSLQL